MKFTLEKWDEPMNDDKCDICDKKGALIRCLKKQCKKQVHAYCVLEQTKLRLIQSATKDSKMDSTNDDSESDPQDN